MEGERSHEDPLAGGTPTEAEKPADVSVAGEPAPSPCATLGHVLVEIDDQGAPGQIFWCNRCNRVWKVTLQSSKERVAVRELAPAIEVELEIEQPADGSGEA